MPVPPTPRAAEPPADEHAARLQALSRPGAPLAADSPHATVNNPRWFVRRHGRPIALPERRVLHEKLLANWRADVEAATQKRAIVLAGPPGAGKSTALRAIAPASTGPGATWRTINSDDFKDLLLRAALDEGTYEELVPPALAELEAAGERFWPRELAALVHEEAGMLAREAIETTIAEGENLVIDGTLSDAARAHALLERLAAAGYSVRVVDVEAPHDVVSARVTGRWRADYLAAEHATAADPAVAELGGRWVPSEVVHALFADETAQESVCAAVARAVAERHEVVGEYAVYRVGEPDGEPKLVERRGRVHGSGLLDAETYRAARTSQAAQPPRPRRSGGEPDRGSERE